MTTLADHLDLLADAIEEMNRSSQSTILKKIDELFGERFGQEERRILKDRYDRRNTSGGDLLIKPGSGTIYAPAIAVSKPEAKPIRSEEHTSEHQSLMPISYAVFCLKTK